VRIRCTVAATGPRLPTILGVSVATRTNPTELGSGAPSLWPRWLPRWIPGAAALGIATSVLLGAWNPWHLVVVSWLDHVVLGGFVVVLLVITQLILGRRRPMLRWLLIGLLTVALIPVSFIGFFVLIFQPVRSGSTTAAVAGRDVTLVIDEWVASPGRRFDTLALRSGRGIAARHREIHVVRTDSQDVAVDVGATDLVVHDCYHATTITFDPETLEVVDTEVVTFERGRPLPQGDLRLPLDRASGGPCVPF
jgi:hypothetical protein